jgi:hypothetical protein
MYRGQIIAVVNAADVTKEQVGLLMAGVPLEEAVSKSDSDER